MTTTVRSTTLGLEASLIRPHLTSISQLPEVAAALEDLPTLSRKASTGVVDSLRRAGDIFASFSKGGPEHLAILALLAEVQQTISLDYNGARQTVEHLRQCIFDATTSSSAVRIEVSLALAKILWMQGDFASCFQHTQALKDDDNTTSDSPEEDLPMHAAAIENARVLSTLMHEGPTAARTAALSLDMVGLPAPAQAAQCLNLGVVEALWGLSNTNCEGDVTCSTQFDTAKQTWKQGLDLLLSADESVNTPLRYALEGRLQSNLAYSVLQYAGRNETQISTASQHARDALKALEHIRSDDVTLPDEGWIRALTLVAQCYHRAGHAVIAEGLLQSALDEAHPVTETTAPLILERRAAYQAYAALCKDWEKRQGDADRFLAQNQKMTSELKGGWKDATEVHSSLWFWTPTKFLS